MSRSDGIVQEFCHSNFKEIVDLKKAHTLYESYAKKCQELETKLSIVSTEVPSNINSALNLAQVTLTKSDEALEHANKLQVDIHSIVENTSHSILPLQDMLFQSNEIDKCIKYFQWLSDVQELSGLIQKNVDSDLLDNACSDFDSLLKKSELLHNEKTDCKYLLKYVDETLIYWYKVISSKLEVDFMQMLKDIGWPFLTFPAPEDLNALLKQKGLETGTNKIKSNKVTNFEKLFYNLLLLQLPKYIKIDDNDSNILLPIKLMAKPLIKRFQYHFSGNKPTNAIGKPEWYLTQVLNWVSNHVDIMEFSIQSIVEKAHNGKYCNSNAFVMFTKLLLKLVYKKLLHDMDVLLYEEDLFAHTIDEILLFEREMRAVSDLVDLALQEDGPINILSQPKCLQKWINTERNCAINRLDDMLSKPEAWNKKFSSSFKDTEVEVNEDKIPECTDLFVTMLFTITDRCKGLTFWKDQMQFIDLQLHLLDDFRLRLTQVLKNEVMTNPLGEIHFAVVNAAYYVTNLLQEWSENLFFLELQQKALSEHQQDRNSMSIVSDEPSLFSGVLQLYKRLYVEACDNINNTILQEFKSKCRPYLESSWLILPPKKEENVLIVSRSACPMLQFIQKTMYLLEDRLSLHLFTILWRNLTDMIDSFFFKELITCNRFNVGGCLQLEYDMVRNLFPLFGPYTKKPENYFRRIKESCILLVLPKGSALLLLEVIDSSTHLYASDPKPSEALRDLGITFISTKEAVLILKLRLDLELDY